MNIPGCLEVVTHTDVREIWRQNAPSSLTALPLSTHFSPASGLITTPIDKRFLKMRITHYQLNGNPNLGWTPSKERYLCTLTETRIIRSTQTETIKITPYMTKKSYYNAVFHLSTLTFIPLPLVSPRHGKAQRENQTHLFEIRVSAGGGKINNWDSASLECLLGHHKPTPTPHQMRSLTTLLVSNQ